MKTFRLLVSISFFLFVWFISFSPNAIGQTVILPERCLLRTGDDTAFSSVTFDDHAWKLVDVPSPWEPQGFDGYNGIAWYRVHFRVDSELVGKPLTLGLGKIDDEFLKGRGLAGEKTAVFEPDEVS